VADQEEIEIKFAIEKAKAQIEELKGEIARVSETKGELSFGSGAVSSVGAGIQSAAGQTGSSIASFAADPVGESIKRLTEVALTQFFPQVTQLLKDGFGSTAVAGRVSPIAEQFARLTGQQLPGDVISGLVQQASGPEQAAIRARGLVDAASQSYLNPLGTLDAIRKAGSDDLARDYQRIMQLFWGSAPPTPRVLGGG